MDPKPSQQAPPLAAKRETSRPRVVIVGGGFGGLTAARKLRRAPVDLILVDRRNHHLFQPLLYQVATAGLSPADIAEPLRRILRRQKNATVLLAQASGVDLQRRTLRLEDGELAYDFLVLACGATHSWFGHDAWARHALGLKTLEDALEIRRRVLLAYERAERTDDEAEREALMTFVVIGGGPTGVEMAGALAEIARQTLQKDFRRIHPETARVLLVEAGPQVLNTFAPSLSTRAARSLRKIGVEVLAGTPVTDIEDGVVRLGEKSIRAGNIIWAAGVRAVPLGATLGVPLDRAGRVLVEKDCTVPGHPEVYVLGDMARLVDAAGVEVPGVAQGAIQAGRLVARNIVHSLRNEAREPLTYKDLGMLATIGRAHAVVQLGSIRFAGYFAWLFWAFLHIALLIGFDKRLIVMVEWIWAYFTFDRGARLITGDRRDSDPPQ